MENPEEQVKQAAEAAQSGDWVTLLVVLTPIVLALAGAIQQWLKNRAESKRLDNENKIKESLLTKVLKANLKASEILDRRDIWDLFTYYNSKVIEDPVGQVDFKRLEIIKSLRKSHTLTPDEAAVLGRIENELMTDSKVSNLAEAGENTLRDFVESNKTSIADMMRKKDDN